LGESPRRERLDELAPILRAGVMIGAAVDIAAGPLGRTSDRPFVENTSDEHGGRVDEQGRSIGNAEHSDTSGAANPIGLQVEHAGNPCDREVSTTTRDFLEPPASGRWPSWKLDVLE
jgi:hypothetical protein